MSIRLHNLDFNYKNQKVITNLSLEIADGGILCVMGESGCGKTTLLGILTGLFRVFGASAEGVSYAIILGNLLVPLIEKISFPKPFGRGGEKA